MTKIIKQDLALTMTTTKQRVQNSDFRLISHSCKLLYCSLCKKISGAIHEENPCDYGLVSSHIIYRQLREALKNWIF